MKQALKTVVYMFSLTIAHTQVSHSMESLHFSLGVQFLGPSTAHDNDPVSWVLLFDGEGPGCDVGEVVFYCASPRARVEPGPFMNYTLSKGCLIRERTSDSIRFDIQRGAYRGFKTDRQDSYECTLHFRKGSKPPIASNLSCIQKEGSDRIVLIERDLSLKKCEIILQGRSR